MNAAHVHSHVTQHAPRGHSAQGPASGGGSPPDAAPDAFAALLQALGGDGAEAAVPGLDTAAADLPQAAEPSAQPDASAPATAPAIDGAAVGPATTAEPPPTDISALLAMLPQAASPAPQVQGGAAAPAVATVVPASSPAMANARLAAAAAAPGGAAAPATPTPAEPAGHPASAPAASDPSAPAAVDTAATSQAAAHHDFRAILHAAADPSNDPAAGFAQRRESDAAAPPALALPHAWGGLHLPTGTPDPGAAPPAATVHQAALPTHPLDAAFAGDLAAEVSVMLQGGLQQAELHLNPSDLGPIRIQLQLDAQTAELSFQAAHATTRDGLEQALPALREMLSAQGLQLGETSVTAGTGGNAFAFAQQDGRQDRRPGEGAPQARTGRTGATVEIDTASAPRPARRLAAGAGMLDLYA